MNVYSPEAVLRMTQIKIETARRVDLKVHPGILLEPCPLCGTIPKWPKRGWKEAGDLVLHIEAEHPALPFADIFAWIEAGDGTREDYALMMRLMNGLS